MIAKILKRLVTTVGVIIAGVVLACGVFATPAQAKTFTNKDRIDITFDDTFVFTEGMSGEDATQIFRDSITCNSSTGDGHQFEDDGWYVFVSPTSQPFTVISYAQFSSYGLEDLRWAHYSGSTLEYCPDVEAAIENGEYVPCLQFDIEFADGSQLGTTIPRIYVNGEPAYYVERYNWTESSKAALRVLIPRPVVRPDVFYRTHVQDVGWQGYVQGGEMSGTSGQSLRLEGIEINLNNNNGGVQYRTHVQDIGWQDFVANGKMSGTSGMSLRLEAIEIELTGPVANDFDIYYRVHCQDFGWMGWAKNGERSGSAGYGYRLEGIQIVIVPKGDPAPSQNYNGIKGNTTVAFSDRYHPGDINYRVHVQDDGWQEYVCDGAMSGTSGRSLRLEGININLAEDIEGGVAYRTHVQDIGWQGFVSNNAMSGTSGMSLRLEAIEIKLTGKAASNYDIYYRVHTQDIGWMGWAKNGERAGSAGFSYRLEGIQIVLVPKGGPAPAATYQGITQVTTEHFVENAG